MTTIGRKCAAEVIGTFWLVFGGCGSAVLAAAFPGMGIGFVGVSLAFGLTVLTMAYAVGPISGAHLNPAVSFGAWVARRLSTRHLGLYVVSQLVGAVIAAAVLYVIATGRSDFTLASGFASNGYGEHSPGGYALGACLVAELVLTAGFVFVVLAVTDIDRPTDVAPLAIGLALTLVHLIGIPVTNTSVNPARSFGPAIFAGDWALAQLWLFWLAPLLGAAIAGLAYPVLSTKDKPKREELKALVEDERFG
jgi:aquaporin Z